MLRNTACCATCWPCMVLIDNVHNLLHKIRTFLISFVQHGCCATRLQCEWWGCTTCVNWNPIVDLKTSFFSFSALHFNADIIATQASELIFNIFETNTMARKTQLNLCNHVATWLESYLQTCVAQNIFAQHDWSWMGPFTSVEPVPCIGRPPVRYKLYILPTQCIGVFRKVLTINSDCFPKQH
jgi:hypothetical protein